MPFEKINEVQETCEIAMSHWGYKIFTHEDVHPNRAILPIDIQPKVIDTKLNKDGDVAGEEQITMTTNGF